MITWVGVLEREGGESNRASRAVTPLSPCHLFPQGSHVSQEGPVQLHTHVQLYQTTLAKSKG